MITRKKVSVLPIYMVGFVWLGYAMFFPLRTLIQYVLCAVVSLAGYTDRKSVV